MELRINRVRINRARPILWFPLSRSLSLSGKMWIQGSHLDSSQGKSYKILENWEFQINIAWYFLMIFQWAVFYLLKCIKFSIKKQNIEREQHSSRMRTACLLTGIFGLCRDSIRVLSNPPWDRSHGTHPTTHPDHTPLQHPLPRMPPTAATHTHPAMHIPLPRMLHLWIDRHLWKHNLPTTSFVRLRSVKTPEKVKGGGLSVRKGGNHGAITFQL